MKGKKMNMGGVAVMSPRSVMKGGGLARKGVGQALKCGGRVKRGK